MDREDKLNKLNRRDTSQKLAIIADDTFAEVLEEKVKAFKDVLNQGIELNNIDDLLEKLELLHNFHQEVKELRVVAEGIKAIKIPDEVSIKELNDLVTTIKNLPVPKVINKINNTNIIDEYQAANTDELDDANSYYGFVHPTGKWYIHWISGGLTSTAFKYSTGADNYNRGWSNRKKLDYKRFDEVSL